jgi:PhzF family phenazine biosynthesis protein
MQMPTKVYIVRAFCKDGNGGNEAGVVLFGDDLRTERKQAIARKLGYSETVFVAHAERADFRLAYFTPTGEVPLCGHATIAAFALMRRGWHSRLHPAGRKNTVPQLRAGLRHTGGGGDGHRELRPGRLPAQARHTEKE